MPFYEYECQNCKFYTELLQKISDPPLKKCPSCGKNQMKKLVSAPVFRLKGAGWYETDFKSDQENKRNLAVEKEEAASSSDKSTDKSTETKPEAKPSEPKTTDAKPVDATPAKAGGSRSTGRSTPTPAPKGASRSRPSTSSSKRSAAKPKAVKRKRR